jgi:hypothetical protein|tara:strand:+ start:50 stop:913 length:864 start_codon:yes stop_codon:yes gene_type:complete
MSNGQGGFYGGVMNLMGQQQMSPDRLRQMLMGEEGSGGVGDILNQQQGLYGSMMEGKIPPSLRMNVMSGAHDLAAEQSRNINRTLGMGGMSPGSNLGAQLSQISESRIGNDATKNLASLGMDTMKMGQEGMGNVLQARQGLNTSMAGLERSNMGESNEWGGAIGGLIGGGIKDWLGGRAGGELDPSGNPIQTRGMDIMGKLGGMFGLGGAGTTATGAGTTAAGGGLSGMLGVLGPIGLAIGGGKLLGEGMDKFMPGYRKGLNKLSTGMFGGRAKNLFTPWKWRLGGK